MFNLGAYTVVFIVLHTSLINAHFYIVVKYKPCPYFKQSDHADRDDSERRYCQSPLYFCDIGHCKSPTNIGYKNANSRWLSAMSFKKAKTSLLLIKMSITSIGTVYVKIDNDELQYFPYCI